MCKENNFFNNFYRHYILWIFCFVAVYTFCYALFFKIETGALFYTDTDPYTRALRIIDWLQDFQWSEKIFPFGNPPDGFVLHFTRICDIIWVFLSLPFMLFMPLKEAVFYGGMFLSPLFCALAIISLFWALRLYLPPLKDKEKFFFISVLITLIFFNKSSSFFDFNMPDHHSLMTFIFCFNLAVMLRNQIKDNHMEIIGAGILSGCGVWASSAPEGFFVALLFLAVFSLNWIFGNTNPKYPLYYSLGLFLSVTFAWLINPPYGGWGVIDNNRLSVIHCTACALILLSFIITSRLQPQTKLQKLIILASSGFVALIIMFVLFGSSQIFAPIYTEDVKNYFVPYISEMEPFFKNKLYIACLLLGTILTVIWIFYTRLRQQYEKNITFLTLFTTAAFATVVRFHIYYLCTFSIIYILMFYMLAALSEKNKRYKTLTFIYLIVLIFYFFSFKYLPKNTHIPQVRGIVLTKVFDGPRLVFERNVDVIGFPYHTNPQGIIKNYFICRLSNEDELKQALKDNNIGFVYLNNDTKLNGQPTENQNGICEEKSLIETYSWLEKADDGLYRVNYEKF